MDRDESKKLIQLTIQGVFSQKRLRDVLVLKGGNALDLIYRAAGRSSDDVDVSMDNSVSPPSKEDLRGPISKGLREVFSDAGYFVFDVSIEEEPKNLSPQFEDFWGGYKVYFKVVDEATYEIHSANVEQLRRVAIKVGGRGKIRIDISKHEYCIPKRRSRLGDYHINVYTPEMIAAEKIRAICQQTKSYCKQMRTHKASRARDFYDLHELYEKGAYDPTSLEFVDLVRRMFDAKRVPKETLLEMKNDSGLHESGFDGLLDTLEEGVSPLEFDEYFDFVSRIAAKLHSRWDE